MATGGVASILLEVKTLVKRPQEAHMHMRDENPAFGGRSQPLPDAPDLGREPRELREPILPDDYPIYGNYLYVADGKVYMSDWHDITVGELKRRENFKEVRRCDMVGRANDRVRL